jgi:hypothetical protein
MQISGHKLIGVMQKYILSSGIYVADHIDINMLM